MECCAIAIDEGQRQAESLVAGAKAGNFAAFEALYKRHAGRIYALCLRMTADPALAEELTQEAFVRAWSKLRTFSGHRGFSAWMRRLTINVVISERRSRARKPADQVDREHLAPAPEPGSAIDLDAAIAKLPDRARAVFVLYDIEGHRHEEIAAMLNIAPGTSKAQLHRARKLLREAL